MIKAYILTTVRCTLKNLLPISTGKYKLPSCLSKIGSMSSGFANISKSMLKKAPPNPKPEIIIPLTRPFLLGRWLHPALNVPACMEPFIMPKPTPNTSK